MASGLRLPSRAAGLIGLVILATGCGPAGGGEPTVADFPTVVAAEATRTDDATWRFDVTLSSPYDTPERYADAWRIVDADGAVLGVRELLHHHSNEQPFTRSLTGVEIPAAVTTVSIQGRDLLNGWSPDSFELTLP